MTIYNSNALKKKAAETTTTTLLSLVWKPTAKEKNVLKMYTKRCMQFTRKRKVNKVQHASQKKQ